MSVEATSWYSRNLLKLAQRVEDAERENERLRRVLERIRDWRNFRHTGEVRDAVGQALQQEKK